MVYIYKNKDKAGEILWTRNKEEIQGSDVVVLERMIPIPVKEGHISVLQADFETGVVWYDLVKTLEQAKKDAVSAASKSKVKNITLVSTDLTRSVFWMTKERRNTLVDTCKANKWLGCTSMVLVTDVTTLLMTPDAILQMVNEMNVFENMCETVLEEHISKINSFETIEEVRAYDYSTGYPYNPYISIVELGDKYDKLNQNQPESQSVVFVRAVINNTTLPAEKALEMKSLYPKWGEGDAAFNTQVEVGFRFTYKVEDGRDEVLYEVIQAHTLQENWVPGLSTASLYKVVEVEKVGTLDDPITYTPPMEIFEGKYYIQDEVKYLCIRDSQIALSHNLSDLVGSYVSIVE